MTKEQLARLVSFLPDGAEVSFSVDISDANSDSQDRVYVDCFDEIKRINKNKFVVCGISNDKNF